MTELLGNYAKPGEGLRPHETNIAIPHATTAQVLQQMANAPAQMMQYPPGQMQQIKPLPPPPKDIGDITWSHSALEQADQCLKRYYEVRVAKNFKQQSGAAGNRGNDVHIAIEHWFKGDTGAHYANLTAKDKTQFGKFTPILQNYADVAKMAERLDIEDAIVMNRDGKPVKYFAKDVWVRAKLDWVLWFNGGMRAFVVDWKTGKVRDTRPQAKRYGWLMFKRFPNLQHVQIQFAYFDQLKTMPAYSWTRDELAGLADDTIASLSKIKSAHDTNSWPETQSGLCRFCEVTSCKFNPN